MRFFVVQGITKVDMFSLFPENGKITRTTSLSTGL